MQSGKIVYFQRLRTEKSFNIYVISLFVRYKSECLMFFNQLYIYQLNL